MNESVKRLRELATNTIEGDGRDWANFTDALDPQTILLLVDVVEKADAIVKSCGQGAAVYALPPTIEAMVELVRALRSLNEDGNA